MTTARDRAHTRWLEACVRFNDQGDDVLGIMLMVAPAWNRWASGVPCMGGQPRIGAHDPSFSWRPASPLHGYELVAVSGVCRRWHTVLMTSVDNLATALVNFWCPLEHDDVYYAGRIHGLWEDHNKLLVKAASKPRHFEPGTDAGQLTYLVMKKARDRVPIGSAWDLEWALCAAAGAGNDSAVALLLDPVDPVPAPLGAQYPGTPQPEPLEPLVPLVWRRPRADCRRCGAVVLAARNGWVDVLRRLLRHPSVTVAEWKERFQWQGCWVRLDAWLRADPALPFPGDLCHGLISPDTSHPLDR